MNIQPRGRGWPFGREDDNDEEERGPPIEWIFKNVMNLEGSWFFLAISVLVRDMLQFSHETEHIFIR